MNLTSMTGFGSAQANFSLGRLQIDIKSVNSRFFEMHPRLPDELRWAENLVRDTVQRAVQRGKIELRISIAQSESSLVSSQINTAGLASALRLSHQIRQNHPEIAPFTVADLLRLPGVVQESSLSQEDWVELLTRVLNQALAEFSQSRQTEGARLGQVITDRLAQIHGLAEKAKSLVPQAVAAQKQRLTERLIESIQGLAAPEQQQALEDRIRQEAAVFGLRIDVAEEIDRLHSHLQAAQQALTHAAAGKRLDFLAQEMNREANTLGSKSPSADLSNVSIEMKLLIEQIREQAQNLE
jgi:uncharacterized protein (TIGR00255 family)